MLLVAFRGWPAEALEFYESLEADNSKTYWTAHKAVYDEKVYAPMVALLTERAPEFGAGLRYRLGEGMHAAVVETDPETAEIKILRYCVVHDCGRLINPRIVAGQIHGGVAQGVGGALYERIVYDGNGQLLNASYLDFLIPYAAEVPAIETDHLETPSPLNPLGVKGAGEAGVIPGAAVLAAALEDAEGIRIDRMPISPSELWELRGNR